MVVFKTQRYLQQAVYYRVTGLPPAVMFSHTPQKYVACVYGLIRRNAPCVVIASVKAGGKVLSPQSQDSARSPNVLVHRRRAMPEPRRSACSSALTTSLSWKGRAFQEARYRCPQQVAFVLMHHDELETPSCQGSYPMPCPALPF